MKLVRVPNHEYGFKNVPAMLLRAVHTLNYAIKVNARAVTEALGSGDYAPCDNDDVSRLEQHPHIILGVGIHGLPVLSGLGLLNGILMTHRFRLFVETEDDNYTIKSVGIMEDLDATVTVEES